MVERNRFEKNSRGEDPRNEEEGVFWHKCVTPGCDRQVEFDDEPWCFTHSPDEGSSLQGYSARVASRAVDGSHIVAKYGEVAHNIFMDDNEV